MSGGASSLTGMDYLNLLQSLAIRTGAAAHNAWIVDGGEYGRFVCNRFFGVTISREPAAEMLRRFNLTDDLGVLEIDKTIMRVDGEPPKTFGDLIEKTKAGSPFARRTIANRPVTLDPPNGQTYPSVAVFDRDDEMIAVDARFVKVMEQLGATVWVGTTRTGVVRAEDSAGEIIGIMMPVLIS